MANTLALHLETYDGATRAEVILRALRSIEEHVQAEGARPDPNQDMLHTGEMMVEMDTFFTVPMREGHESSFGLVVDCVRRKGLRVKAAGCFEAEGTAEELLYTNS